MGFDPAQGGGGGGGGASDLPTALAAGNTTDGTDLEVSNGDQILFNDGTDTSQGIAVDSTDILAITNGTTGRSILEVKALHVTGASASGDVAQLRASGLELQSGLQTAWSNSASNTTTLDTGLERVAAGVVGVTDGSTGTGTIEIVGSKIPFLQWDALQGIAPSSNFATLGTRNGHRVLEYDDTTQEATIFHGVLPYTYSGAGLTVDLYWLAASATSGAAAWDVSIESHTDDADDLDSDSFAAANSGSSTTASATGEVKVTTITFTDGADMDSLAAGESFRLKVERDADGTNNTDDMTGDAQLLRVVLRET